MDLIDHQLAAIARLPSFLEDATTFQAILRALLAPSVDLEQDFQTFAARMLDTAQGQQLDDIGALLLSPRSGRADDTYRLWLRARLLVLRGHGRSDEMIKIIQLLDPGVTAVSIQSLAPSTAHVEVEGLSIPAATLHAILNTARGSGIRLDLAWTVPGENAFIFGDTLENEADTVHGIGDVTDPLVGGVMSGIIT